MFDKNKKQNVDGNTMKKLPPIVRNYSNTEHASMSIALGSFVDVSITAVDTS